MEQPLAKRANVGTFRVAEKDILAVVEQLCKDSEENVNAWNRLKEIANYLGIDSTKFQKKSYLCRAILDRLGRPGIREISNEVLIEIASHLKLEDILKLIYTDRAYFNFFGHVVSQHQNALSETWMRFLVTKLEAVYGPNQAVALSMWKDLLDYGYPCNIKIEVGYLAHVLPLSENFYGWTLNALGFALWTKHILLFELCVSSPMFNINDPIHLPATVSRDKYYDTPLVLIIDEAIYYRDTPGGGLLWFYRSIKALLSRKDIILKALVGAYGYIGDLSGQILLPNLLRLSDDRALELLSLFVGKSFFFLFLFFSPLSLFSPPSL